MADLGSVERIRARSMTFGPTHGASARTEALVEGRSGRERLVWNVRGLPHDGGEAALLLDDGSGTMVVVATGHPSHGGRVRFRFDTREGERLPLGAATDHDLAGRAFRVDFDGIATVTGNLPLI